MVKILVVLIVLELFGFYYNEVHLNFKKVQCFEKELGLKEKSQIRERKKRFNFQDKNAKDFNT